MDKPIETFSGCCNVICHYFSESFIVGDDEEVDHYDVAQLQAVDQIRDTHLTKSIQDDYGCAGM
jgi:hypothetical protein